MCIGLEAKLVDKAINGFSVARRHCVCRMDGQLPLASECKPRWYRFLGSLLKLRAL